MMWSAHTGDPILATRVNVGDWQEVPRWHWRRLFGWTMRRLALEGDFAPCEQWEYFTAVKAAQIILDERFNAPPYGDAVWDGKRWRVL